MKFSLQVTMFVLFQTTNVATSALPDVDHNRSRSSSVSENLRGRDLTDSSCFDCSDKNPCFPSLFTSDVYYYPRCGSVTTFVQCGDAGECHIQPCPPGQHWDPDTLVCGLAQPTHAPSAAPSASPSNSCFDCTDGRNPCDPLVEPNKYYYSNCDLHKYVQCSDAGQCFEHDCPINLQWDDIMRACVNA
mmetsp:Transcript_31604/g.41966  ORF Transcript_31604/g.41966 Transcript_31604/m.41966 type:complete len:188 (+) Transcript_31604:106-669(+)